MRLRAARVFPCFIPLREPFLISGASLEVARNVLVELTDADGRVGWGEASPVERVTGETQDACVATMRRLARALLEAGAAPLADHLECLERCAPAAPTARSALDLALHDLAAQAAGEPLYRHLGGRRRPMETDATLFLRPLDSLPARAAAVRAAGFRMIKVKLGHPDGDDVERMRRVREAAGPDAVLRADANEGWTRERAAERLEALAPFGVEFCEQPCPAAREDDFAWLHARSPIPLMADESLFSPDDARRLAARGLPAYFNIKLCKAGGLHRAREIAAVAAAAGMPCMVGCMSESRLGLAASAHFAMAHDIVRFFDLDSFLPHAEDPILGGLRIERGFVELSDAPGLGAAPDPRWLARLEALAP